MLAPRSDVPALWSLLLPLYVAAICWLCLMYGCECWFGRMLPLTSCMDADSWCALAWQVKAKRSHWPAHGLVCATEHDKSPDPVAACRGSSQAGSGP